MKKEYLIAAGIAGAGLMGVAVGFIFGTKKAQKDFEKTIPETIERTFYEMI